MAEKLIAVNGAKIYCPQAIGNLPNHLVGTSGIELTGCSNCVLTEDDNLPGENILPFMGCKTLGTCTPIPKPSAENRIWYDTGKGLTNIEERVLIENSFFVCQASGAEIKVEIQETNQDTIRTVAMSHGEEEGTGSGTSGGAEHEKNKRPSTKGKHEKGQERKRRDRGGEKGDNKRRQPRKRPQGHKGPWPPKESLMKGLIIGGLVLGAVAIGVAAAATSPAWGTALGIAAVAVVAVGVLGSLFGGENKPEPPDFV